MYFESHLFSCLRIRILLPSWGGNLQGKPLEGWKGGFVAKRD